MKHITLHRTLGWAAFALAAGPAPAFAQQCEQKLTDSAGGNVDDHYGQSVAMTGNHVAVGVPGDDQPFGGGGSVFVYERSGLNNWSFQKKLTDGTANDEMGGAVSISIDHILSGARLDLSGRGAAYVFRKDLGGTDNWGQVKKLQAAGGGGGDGFGTSVSISGDQAVVGALDNLNGFDSGSARLFERNAGGADNWGEVKTLTASDAQGGDWFGLSIAIEGDTIVAGAPFEDAGGGNAGAVYIFGRNQGGANNWGQVKKIQASVPGVNDQFGWSISLYGNTVAVGAPRHNGDDGALYIFERDAGGANNWGQTHILSGGCNNGRLGDSVTTTGGLTIGGGAPGCGAGGISTGAVQVFGRHQGGTNHWGLVTTLLASDGAAFDEFGIACGADDGGWVTVGAVGDDDLGSGSGSAYVYRIDQCAFATTYCYCTSGPCGNDDPDAGCANSTGSGAELNASGTGSVTADDLVLTVTNVLPNVSTQFFKAATTTFIPYNDGNLCITGSLTRFPIQTASAGGVATQGPGIVAFCAGAPPAQQISPGQTWCFQVNYRNSIGPCGTGANTSNAIQILFGP
jgi:hypothetical protein